MIFFQFQSTDNIQVLRRTDIMEVIGLIFRGTDNKMHFYPYRTKGEAPESYRTEEMRQIIGLMASMER